MEYEKVEGYITSYNEEKYILLNYIKKWDMQKFEYYMMFLEEKALEELGITNIIYVHRKNSFKKGILPSIEFDYKRKGFRIKLNTSRLKLEKMFFVDVSQDEKFIKEVYRLLENFRVKYFATDKKQLVFSFNNIINLLLKKKMI